VNYIRLARRDPLGQRLPLAESEHSPEHQRAAGLLRIAVSQVFCGMMKLLTRSEKLHFILCCKRHSALVDSGKICYLDSVISGGRHEFLRRPGTAALDQSRVLD